MTKDFIFPQDLHVTIRDHAIDKDIYTGIARHGGLSKRELFAAMAMQGSLANEYWNSPRNKKDSARVFVEWADALIAELGKG